jgi:hypothetical protein
VRIKEEDINKTIFRTRYSHYEFYGSAFWMIKCISCFHVLNEWSVQGIPVKVCDYFLR